MIVTDDTMANRPDRALPTIGVAGDGAIDQFLEEIRYHILEEGAAPRNWQLEPGYQIHRLQGGALLLATMISVAIGMEMHDTTAPLGEGLLHSLALIEPAPRPPQSNEPEPWRVSRFLGFQRLSSAHTATGSLFIPADRTDPSVLVIDNAGNGYRQQSAQWDSFLQLDRLYTLLVIKMHLPLPRGIEGEDPLWDRFIKMQATRKVVIVNGSDLRHADVDLSARLSWDRTMNDLQRQSDHGTLKALQAGGTVVVRLGCEGAAIIEPDDLRLVCEPGYIENDTQLATRHFVPGGTTAFTAALVADLISSSATQDAAAGLDRAVRSGLAVSHRLHTSGFVMNNEGTASRRLALPLSKIFGRAANDAGPIFQDGRRRETLFQCELGGEIPALRQANWDTANGDARLAEQIVRTGAKQLVVIPHTAIGLLQIADRQEIEDYRCLDNLIASYAADLRSDKPISVAVFGSPGSGKSFGIKAIAKAFNDSGRTAQEITTDEFNVAQWRDSRDLVGALHIARDRRISGKLPLIFFDEFDSKLGETDKGWLKAFLAPMQDGAFKDGEHNHIVDRAIFVFAGGTAFTLDQFNPRDGNEAAAADADKFRDAKGPDFVSRLSGFVNLSSIDQSKSSGFGPRLRRAIVLRSLIERKYPNLVDRKGRIRIDQDVLHALLSVSLFHHGIRSIEAILKMSALGHSSTRFARSALPPDAQIELHTSAAAFKTALDDSVI